MRSPLKVGDTINATYTPADATDPTFAWTADGTPILGATTASYVVGEADLGKKISVTVTDVTGATFTAETEPVQGDPEADLAITAEQTGATEITVKANKAVAATDAVLVMRGTSTIDNTFVTDAAGTTITITTGTKISANAEYTVTITPKDTTKKAATATFTGLENKLESIDFVGENLILTDSTYDTATVKIFGYDSFGDQVALSTLQPYSSKGTPTYTAADNEISITTTSTAPFTTGEKVTVTAVYQDGTNVQQVSKSLTISAMSTVAEMTFGDLQTSSTTLKDKRVTLSAMDSGTYYKEVSAKDQYDNELTAKKLNDILYDGSASTTKTLFATPYMAAGSYVYLTGFDTTTDNKVIAKYDLGALNMPGTQTFTYTAVGGYSVTDSIAVEDDPYIASLAVTVPEMYSGKEAELTLTATDQYGDALDLYDLVGNSNNGGTIGTNAGTGSFTSAAAYLLDDYNHTTKSSTSIALGTTGSLTLKVTKNTSKKTVKFTLTGTNGTTSNINSNITVTTATPTVNNYPLTVQPAAHPYGLSAKLKASGSATVTLGGATASWTPESDVIMLDQYGASMGTIADVVAKADYTVNYNSTTTAYTVSSTATQGQWYAEVIGKTSSGSQSDFSPATALSTADTYTVNLWYAKDTNTLEKQATRTFTVQDQGTVKTYTASVKAGYEKLYIESCGTSGFTAGSGDDSVIIEVKGKDAAGNETTLSPGSSNDYTLTVDNTDLLEVISGDTGIQQKTIAAGAAVDNSKKEGTATVTVWVNGEEVATTSFTFSGAAPTADKIVAEKSTDSGSHWAAYADTNIEVSAPTLTDRVTTLGNREHLIIADGTTQYKFGIADQYGQPFDGQTVTIGGKAVSAVTPALGQTYQIKIVGGSLSQTWTMQTGATQVLSGISTANTTTAASANITVTTTGHTTDATIKYDASAGTITVDDVSGTDQVYTLLDQYGNAYTGAATITPTFTGTVLTNGTSGTPLVSGITYTINTTNSTVTLTIAGVSYTIAVTTA